MTANLIHGLSQQDDGSSSSDSIPSQKVLQRTARAPREIPERIADSFRRRFASMPPAELELLQTASVFGEELLLSLLAQVTQQDVADVLALLRRPTHEGLVRQENDSTLRFSHALVREVLYRDLDVGRRFALHAAIGQSMAERLAIHPSWLIQVAHHYLQAAPESHARSAVDFALLAADWCRKQHNYPLAAHYYHRALDTTEALAPNPLERGELLLNLAQMQFLSGEADAALKTFNELFELVEFHEFNDLFRRAVLGYYELRREDSILESAFHSRLQHALRLAQQPGPVRAQLLACHVATSLFIAPVHKLIDEANEALQAARSLNDPSVLCAVLDGINRSYLYPTEPQRTIDFAEEMLQAANSTRLLHVFTQAHKWKAGCLLETGKGKEFFEQIQQLEMTAARFPYPPARYWGCVFGATRVALLADLDRSEKAYRFSLTQGQTRSLIICHRRVRMPDVVPRT